MSLISGTQGEHSRFGDKLHVCNFIFSISDLALFAVVGPLSTEF